MGQTHQGHGNKCGGCSKPRPEHRQKRRHPGGESGGLDRPRLDADSWTDEPRGAQPAAARKTAEIKAKTKAKAKPGTNTITNTYTENLIATKWNGNIIGKSDQTLRDRRSSTLKETGHPSPSHSPTTCLSMADRDPILRRDNWVQLTKKMDQEITSDINKALFQSWPSPTLGL